MQFSLTWYKYPFQGQSWCISSISCPAYWYLSGVYQVFHKLPGGSEVKVTASNAGDLGLIPGLGGFPGEEKGYPIQYSGLENSMDCMVHGVAKSWTWLSNFHSLTHTPITSWQIDELEQTMETVTDFILGGSKITADGDCSHEIKKTFAPWKENYDKSRQCIQKQRHHFANKGPYSQSYGFSSSHVWI